MQVEEIRVALASAVRQGVPSLTSYDYPAESVVAPAFYAGDFQISYDQSTGGGTDDAYFRCYVLTSRADDRSGHTAIGQYVGRSGPYSVKRAIEADRTLGGVVEDVQVTDVQSLGPEEVAGLGYLGAAFTVRVLTHEPDDDD